MSSSTTKKSEEASGYKTFGDRLRAIQEHFTSSITAFADELGVSRQTVYDWLDSDTHTPKAIGHIVSTYPTVRMRWLIAGEGEMLSNPPDEIPASAIIISNPPWEKAPTDAIAPAPTATGKSAVGAVVAVRHFGPASAGDGSVLDDPSTIQLTAREYAQTFGSHDPDEVGFFQVVGDSAAPIYFDEEDVPVLVEGDTQRFQNDTLYVFRHRDSVMLKRLRRTGGGEEIVGLSLNPSIPAYRFQAGEGDFEVLGRVIDTTKQQLYTSMMRKLFNPAERREDTSLF